MFTHHRRSRLAWAAALVAAALLAPTSGTARIAAAAQSILISGGTVVDGAGHAPMRADVRIEDDHISQIGKLTPRAGERVIDARGLDVAPGFIDAHSHADGGLLADPDAETQVRQGITTSVVGQDGSSHYPLADFFQQVANRHVALNIASFVGEGTARDQVMGKDYKRLAAADEITRMQQLVNSEMRSGAVGLSTGLEYDPGFYSNTEELIALSRSAAAHGGIYISHVRDEGDKALDSFRELIRIGHDGGLPAQISHIKLDTAPVWHKSGEALRLMAEARSRGQDVTADIYPYTYWQSTIIVIIPTRDWSDRAAWAKGLQEVGGPGHVLLTTYTPDASWAGKTIAHIAAMTGKDPITVIQEIVHTTHDPGATGRETVLVTAMTEADVTRFIQDPHIMFCTDGGLHILHPRGAGSYPRVLGRYVRQRHVLTIQEAVRKMTSLPAWRMGFHDRGRLAPGMKADIVLFNPLTVLDTASVTNPQSPPTGIPYVLVNGIAVVANGQITHAHPGQVLRHQG